MWPKLSVLLAVSALLASSSLAAPALDVPTALEPHQTACPTITRPKTWVFSTVWLATTTMTNRWSTLVSVTSTKTESRNYTVTTFTTVTSPTLLTLPTTTSTSFATVTTTFTSSAWTETVTDTGYAPASQCVVTTVTEILPTTSSITYTQDLFYATTWLSLTGHVSTTTEVLVTTTTRTTTKPGATTYLTTVTTPLTLTFEDETSVTATATVYAKGCETWACRL